MNTSENIVMTIAPEIIKDRVLQFASELYKSGEFDKFASKYNLTFTKSELDEFLRDDIIDMLIQEIQQGGEDEGESKDRDNLEECIICVFFDYQKTRIKNRVLELTRELCERGEFKKFASEHDLSFTASKLDEFLRDYTIDQMVEVIQREGDNAYSGKLGDHIISTFFEFRRKEIKNRVIKILAEFCISEGFQKIASEYNLVFDKSKLDQFLRANLDEMVKAIMLEKDSLYEGEDGNKLLQGYLVSVCVENTMM